MHCSLWVLWSRWAPRSRGSSPATELWLASTLAVVPPPPPPPGKDWNAGRGVAGGIYVCLLDVDQVSALPQWMADTDDVGVLPPRLRPWLRLLRAETAFLSH